MIVVDSSVWISQMRGRDTVAVEKLRREIDPDDIVVGDLILLELLQGARDELQAERIETALRAFRIEPMLDEGVAVAGARNVRILRRRGITARKTVDIIIATFCVLRGHRLLHDDRDFSLMAPTIGLSVV